MDTEATHPINGDSIAALVVLLLANVLVVHPLALPLPLALSDLLRKAAYHARITADDGSSASSSTSSSSSGASTGADVAAPAAPLAAAASDGRRRLKARLGLVSAPFAGVLILLASGTISGATVRKGIVGDGEGLKPYDISASESAAWPAGLRHPSFRARADPRAPGLPVLLFICLVRRTQVAPLPAAQTVS